MKLASTLGLGLALLSGGLALAQPATPPVPTSDARPDRGPRGERGARMFELLDANRDARVTFEEAWAFVNTRFTAADTDRSGGLNMAEFAGLRASPADAPSPRPEQAARMDQMRAGMFRALDADSNGQITLVEIRPMVEARFRAADANADGAVVRDEMPQRGHHRGGHHGGGHHGGATPPAR